MARVIWSPEAYERLKTIKEFIEKDSPQASQKIVQGILEQIDTIARFRRIGKSAFSSTYPNLRLLIWKKYKIYYNYHESDDVVEIWGIWDSRSMLPKI